MANSPHANSNSNHPKPASFAKAVRRWVVWLLPAISLLIVGSVLIVALIVLTQVGWVKVTAGVNVNASQSDASEIYTCPMHPQIRQPGEGRCPICGMALVPANVGGADLDQYAINIEPTQRRLANIQTAQTAKRTVFRTIETIGRIEIDESRQAIIASYIDGRVERLFADYTGVVVSKGDHLAEVYSPQLYSAQVEYVESKRTLNNMQGAALASVREVQQKLVANSRQKLSELGMTDEQIDELDSTGNAKSRLTIYTSIAGTVVEKFAEEGKYISAGEPIYRIANLSTVWLILELYPEDASHIRFGQVVKASLPSIPGTPLQGRVAFVDPTVEQKNRTVGVRVEFTNEGGRLRPGDYAQATIEIPVGPQGEVYDAELAGKWISPMHPQVVQDTPGDCPICGMKLVPTTRYGYSNDPVQQQESIVIPRSALLMAGDYSVVYVETKPGRFELRSVKLGPILRNEAVILSGVKAGEQVATSGNFLIDSQMQLAGKPSLIDPTRFVPKASRNEPLQFDAVNVVRVDGEQGSKLEAFYQAYFAIQRKYVQDKLPSEDLVNQLGVLANELSNAEEFATDTKQLFGAVKENAAHLHHLSLGESRQKFKTVSHAVVALATQVRGAAAKQPFHHFFCPMVKQGGGDWLQSEARLSNPYFGNEMLRCGDLVRTIPPNAQTQTPEPSEPNDSHPHDHSTKSGDE